MEGAISTHRKALEQKLSKAILEKVVEHFVSHRVFMACLTSSIILYEALKSVGVHEVELVEGFYLTDGKAGAHVWVEVGGEVLEPRRNNHSAPVAERASHAR